MIYSFFPMAYLTMIFPMYSLKFSISVFDGRYITPLIKILRHIWFRLINFNKHRFYVFIEYVEVMSLNYHAVDPIIAQA